MNERTISNAIRWMFRHLGVTGPEAWCILGMYGVALALAQAGENKRAREIYTAGRVHMLKHMKAGNWRW